MKNVYFDRNAKKEFSELSDAVQDEFQSLIHILIEKGRLDYPNSKKLDKNLYENQSQITRRVSRILCVCEG